MQCEVCTAPIGRGKRCKHCRRIHDALSADPRSDVNAITTAMRRAYRGGRFYCHYSGIELNTENSGSPFYRSIDHRTPGDRNDVVLCAIFINQMKGDLAEDEFRAAVRVLADCFAGKGTADFSSVSFRHWQRHWLGKPIPA